MRRVFKGLGVLIAALILAAVGLWVATMGDYSVAATVTDDPALPAIEVDGVRLHSESFGPAGGPVIVVLHGGPGGDYRSLLPLKALAEDGYRVVFYDQRGAGLSERLPPEALTLATHLAELDAIASMVQPDRPVILIGHSWGAMLAAAYLGRDPDRVSRAVLIEPGFLSAAEAEAFITRMQAVIRTPSMLWTGLVTGFEAMHVTGPDPSARNDYLIGQMMHAFADHPETPYHCPDRRWDSPSWRSGSVAGSAVQGAATAEDLDSLGAVGDYAGPVMLMSGACNDWIGPPLQEEHVKRFTDARHVVIPDAGHDVIDDQPAAALAAIRAFLAP